MRATNIIIIVMTNINPQDTNIFDRLPALSQPKPTASAEELNSYLNADIEDVSDPIAWWHGHRKTYPRLSRMALDYLTIPGMFLFYH